MSNYASKYIAKLRQKERNIEMELRKAQALPRLIESSSERRICPEEDAWVASIRQGGKLLIRFQDPTDSFLQDTVEYWTWDGGLYIIHTHLRRGGNSHEVEFNTSHPEVC